MPQIGRRETKNKTSARPKPYEEKIMRKTLLLVTASNVIPALVVHNQRSMPLCKVTANLTGIFHLHLSFYYVIKFFLTEIVSLVGNLGLQYTYTIKVFFYHLGFKSICFKYNLTLKIKK